MSSTQELLLSIGALERGIVQSLRIDQLERELLRRDVEKLIRRRNRRRREALQALAELDRIAAAVAKVFERREG